MLYACGCVEDPRYMYLLIFPMHLPVKEQIGRDTHTHLVARESYAFGGSLGFVRVEVISSKAEGRVGHVGYVGPGHRAIEV